MKRLPLFVSLLALIVLSASIAYWVLQLYTPQQRPLAAAPLASLPEPGIDAAAGLFGGQAAAAVATNYQLSGVIAAGRESVAIIVADGSAPHALKLGKEVVPGVSVQEVHPRYVMLSEGGVLKRIELATDSKAGAGLTQSSQGADRATEQQPVQQPIQQPPVQQPVQQPIQQPVQQPVQQPIQQPIQPPQVQPQPIQQPQIQPRTPTPAPVPAGAAPVAVPSSVMPPPPPPAVQMPPPTRAVGTAGSANPTQ
jgi:general secretion pathway protein C